MVRNRLTPLTNTAKCHIPPLAANFVCHILAPPSMWTEHPPHQSPTPIPPTNLLPPTSLASVISKLPPSHSTARWTGSRGKTMLQNGNRGMGLGEWRGYQEILNPSLTPVMVDWGGMISHSIKCWWRHIRQGILLPMACWGAFNIGKTAQSPSRWPEINQFWL